MVEPTSHFVSQFYFFFQFVLVSLFAEILIFLFILRMEKLEFSVAFWTICIRASLKASIDISTNFAIVPLASVDCLFPGKLSVFWFFVCWEILHCALEVTFCLEAQDFLSSIVQNRLKLETIRTRIKNSMDKLPVKYSYNGTVDSWESENISHGCCTQLGWI